MHLKETVACTGVYRVRALTKLWRWRPRSIPPYLPEKVTLAKALPLARSMPRLPCSLGYSKQERPPVVDEKSTTGARLSPDSRVCFKANG